MLLATQKKYTTFQCFLYIITVCVNKMVRSSLRVTNPKRATNPKSATNPKRYAERATTPK